MSRKRKFIGFWIVLIMFGAVFPGAFYLMSFLLDAVLGLPRFVSQPAGVFLAAFCVATGLFWITWAYSYLHFVGRGSPIEAFGLALYPTQTLVTTGPYAYTRNPMLVGLIFLLLAIAFYRGSISGLALIPIIAVAAVLYIKAFEEPGLARRFGEEYVEYRRKVPMLIPSLRLRLTRPQ